MAWTYPQPQLLRGRPVSAWSFPWATMPSEMYLLQHGLTHDCSPSRGVFAVSWAYPQPHTLGYSSMTSSTATGVLRCAFSSMDLPLGHNPFRGPAAVAQGHRCCEMHLLWHGLIQGHRCLRVSSSHMDSPTDHRPFHLSSHWSSSLSRTAAQQQQLWPSASPTHRRGCYQNVPRHRRVR